MSQLLINDYLRQLDIIKKVSGSQRETIVSEAWTYKLSGTMTFPEMMTDHRRSLPRAMQWVA